MVIGLVCRSREVITVWDVEQIKIRVMICKGGRTIVVSRHTYIYVYHQLHNYLDTKEFAARQPAHSVLRNSDAIIKAMLSNTQKLLSI